MIQAEAPPSSEDTVSVTNAEFDDVVQTVSPLTGERFVQALVCKLCEVVGVAYAFIAPGTRASATSTTFRLTRSRSTGRSSDGWARAA